MVQVKQAVYWDNAIVDDVAAVIIGFISYSDEILNHFADIVQ